MATIKNAVLEAQLGLVGLREKVERVCGKRGDCSDQEQRDAALAAVEAVDRNLIGIMRHVKKADDPKFTGTVHELKTAVSPFMAVRRGEKTFEIRVNDRGFQIGDVLKLWCFDEGLYTGHWITALVTYIIDLNPFVTAAEGDFAGMSIDIIDHGYDKDRDDDPVPF